MKAADALDLLDQTYADGRRAALSMLLSAPGDPDLAAIEQQFAEFDADYEAQRARLVEWLAAGGAASARRPANG